MPPKAKESPQIKRARQKLKEQIKTAEKKMNAEALSIMSRLIKEQLSRQKSGRINLKKHRITSLEENKNVAKTESKFVLKLLNQIKNENISPENTLEGRIKIFPDKNS